MQHEAAHDATANLLAVTGGRPYSAGQFRNPDVSVVGDRFDAFQLIRARDLSAATLLPGALRLRLRGRGRRLGGRARLALGEARLTRMSAFFRSGNSS